MLRTVLVLVLGLLASSASAQDAEWHAWDLEEFSMEWYRIANNRDAYFPYADMGEEGEFWDYGTAAKFNLNLLRRGDYGLYWRNAVRGNSTNVQFRSVAWDFRWGLKLGKRLDFFYDHTSEHILDAAPRDGGRTYKLRNFYGVEWVFYRRGEN
jgi:hypothetical protein